MTNKERKQKDSVLFKACEECVADAGKENDELVGKIFDFMFEEYDSKGKPWSYDIIDALIEGFDEYAKAKERESVEFRELDGVYFRVKRNEKWQNICFSDMTEDEMKEVMKGRTLEWTQQLAIIMAQQLRKLGDMFDIMPTGSDEDE